MTILRKRFHYHEKGNHDEKWFYLAKDTDTGRVFIIHAWAEKDNIGESEMTIPQFIEGRKDTALSKFYELVGSLATDKE